MRLRSRRTWKCGRKGAAVEVADNGSRIWKCGRSSPTALWVAVLRFAVLWFINMFYGICKLSSRTSTPIVAPPKCDPHKCTSQVRFSTAPHLPISPPLPDLNLDQPSQPQINQPQINLKQWIPNNNWWKRGVMQQRRKRVYVFKICEMRLMTNRSIFNQCITNR